MKKLLIILIVGLVLINSYFVNAQNKEIEKSEKEIIIVKALPAPKWAIEKANEYIISLLGKKYFKEEFSLYHSFTSNPSAKGSWSMYGAEYLYKKSGLYTQIRLDKEGNVMQHKGLPKKPYKFLITKQEVEIIAKAQGMEGDVISEIRYVSPENFAKDISENYVWNVETTKMEPYKPYFIFIDVDSGKVLHIDYFGSLIMKGGIATENNVNVSNGIVSKEICSKGEEKTIENYDFYCDGEFWQLQKQRSLFKKLVSWVINLFKK